MIDSSGLPFGKPPSRAGARAEKRREHNAVVSETRALVFELDRVCAVCGGWPRASDEMHEVIPRSQTRGQPIIMRFNRGNCVRLHRDCHRQVTEHSVELAFLDPERGVDGGLIIQRRGAQDATLYRRHEIAPGGTVNWEETSNPQKRLPVQHISAGRGVAWRRTWTPRDDNTGNRST